MKALTKKQIAFLLSYPWIHFALCILSVYVSARFGFNYAEQTPSIFIQLLSAFATGLFRILLLPWVILQKIGVTIPTHNYLNYFWMYLIGVFYSLVIVLSYKACNKR